MITSITHAINRVRLLVERSDSPWVSDLEIARFLEMGINEFIRERVDRFGFSQKIRDDFGGLVRSAVFGRHAVAFTAENQEPIIVDDEEAMEIDDDLYQHSWNSYNPVNYQNPGGELSSVACNMSTLDTEIFAPGYVLDIKIRKMAENETATESLGYPYGDTSNIGGDELFPCKIISIDDAMTTANDPFHKPEYGDFRAVKVERSYYILPGDTINDFVHQVIITFIATKNKIVTEEGTLQAGAFGLVPIHSREEICQIAARKILGVTADERYPIEDAEIKQLDRK
jgi:hypothetical protein